MSLLFALPTGLSIRKSRRQRRKTAVASGSGLIRGLRLEPLEARQLLSVNIPIYNGDFEAQTWQTNNNVNWYQAAVLPDTQANYPGYSDSRYWQAMNSNALDPRFSPPGYGKTAQGGNGPGPNGEGLYNERNDLGVNQYFNYVDGHLPAPASGTNFFCVQPAPGGTYNFWVDQQPNTAVDGGNPNDFAYPPMIAATVAHAGVTYQVTVALGNPLVNASNPSFPNVEMDFTLGSGSYSLPSHTNRYDYATGQTVPPQPGDTGGSYNGYGTTVASAHTVDPNWVTPGNFRDLTLTWTCPPEDDGIPLDIMFVYSGISKPVCMDNIRLADITTPPAAPSGLVAAGVNASQINLNWTDNSTNESGFKIDQSTSSDFSTGVTTTTVGPNVNYYSATGLSSSSTYYFRVRATNSGGDSANTATASAMTGVSAARLLRYLCPMAVLPRIRAGYYLDASGHNGGGGTFTQPITGTLSGWSLRQPEHRQRWILFVGRLESEWGARQCHQQRR